MRVSTKRAKKVALKNMTPKQLREVIRQLKRNVKAHVLASRAEASRRVKEVEVAQTAHRIHMNSVRGRAERARKYIDLGTPKPLNAAIAIAEWVAYGPLGDYPNRNGGGIHPFKRWGLETPEDREARLEREEKERNLKYRASCLALDYGFTPLLRWHE